ncbi:MAG TPA: ABC transporter substrate-binding protein [Candidatus Acidoferrum sp.]|nr:ABC transporter substrate-binding protein [Candidatus Acidoferrum sp.]
MAPLVANYYHEFAKENLTVNVVVIPNPNSLPPLATGGVSLAIESWGPSVYNAIASGQKIAAIGNPFSVLPGLGFYVQSAYKSCAPACLRGKTIAMPGGLTTSSAPSAASWLAQGHLNLSDVHILNVPVIANIPTAITQNVAQAAWIVPPFQKALLAAGTVKTAYILPAGNLLEAYMVGPAGYSHPAAVEAFLRAIARTAKDYLKPGFIHRPAMVQVLSQLLGQPPSVIETTTEPRFDPTLSLKGLGPKSIVIQKTFFSIGGLLNYSTPLPTSKVINDSYLQAALAGK